MIVNLKVEPKLEMKQKTPECERKNPIDLIDTHTCTCRKRRDREKLNLIQLNKSNK